MSVVWLLGSTVPQKGHLLIAYGGKLRDLQFYVESELCLCHILQLNEENSGVIGFFTGLFIS